MSLKVFLLNRLLHSLDFPLNRSLVLNPATLQLLPLWFYTRAHLRSYARLLGLDEAKIIDLFSNSLATEDRDQKALIRKITSRATPLTKKKQLKTEKAKGSAGLFS